MEARRMSKGEVTKRQALLILNALPHIGPVTANRLLAEFGGDAAGIFTASSARLRGVRGVREKMVGAVSAWTNHFDLRREEAQMAAAGVSFVTREDSDYPPLLREIPDPPIGLYRKGHYAFDRPCVAIVGSRRTTLYGQSTALRLAAELARLGYCVASGLARGIDTAAHDGALSVEGKTAAVLGHGIDRVYPPENLKLYRRIESSGVVLSEFPLGRPADRQSFAMRNRIVAGMSVALIVIESDVDGGSMITAKFAADQGRLVFAVPGRIDQATSAGCHQLIRDGATLLTSVDDVLSELNYLQGLHPAAANGGPPAAVVRPAHALTAEERQVLACFAGGAILNVDALSGLVEAGDASALSVVLMRLELKRLLVRRLDGTYEART